jgi:flagellar protein FliS
MFMPRDPATAYRRIGIESDVGSATPHHLVRLLYDHATDAVRAARAHLSRGQAADKGRAVGMAIRILEEGLKASLDPAGGDLTDRLHALYAYLIVRLVQASRENDDGIFAEVETILASLREAWIAIDPGVPPSALVSQRVSTAGRFAA